MKNARTRAIAAGAVAALCLTPLAACGGSNDKAGSSSSSHYTPLTKATFAKEVSGAMVHEKSAHMTMSMAGMKGEGDFRYDGGATVMKMDMAQGAQKVDMILADKNLYMQAPGMTPAGKWMKIDSKTPGVGQMLSQLDNLDPAAQVKTMEKGLKKVQYVGEKNDLYRYNVTVDPRVGLQGTNLPATSVPSELTYAMSLDDHNLLRSMTMDIQGQHMVMTMSNWGEKVDVTAPPAKDVVAFKVPGQ